LNSTIWSRPNFVLFRLINEQNLSLFTKIAVTDVMLS
jgi:hypothetical protein